MIAATPKPLIRLFQRSLVAALIVFLIGISLGPAHAAGRTTAYSEAADQAPLASTPPTLQPGQKLRALATTSIVGDVVKQVGGDFIDLTVLLPLGSDPHAFEPRPSDLAAISDAQVIFANGAGLEQSYLNKMLQNADASTPVIYVSDGIPLRYLATDQPGPTPPPGQEENGGNDPHTWFSPTNVVVWVHNITNALVAREPAHASDYRTRAADYEAALTQLDAWIKSEVAQIPSDQRKLVTDHLVFGYFADRYGFEQVGAVIPSFSTEAQPSAQDLAHLEDVIRKTGAKAVFVSNTENQALEKRVASDTGIKLVSLFTESLGGPGSGASTYLEFMHYDVNVIVNALK